MTKIKSLTKIQNSKSDKSQLSEDVYLNKCRAMIKNDRPVMNSHFKRYFILDKEKFAARIVCNLLNNYDLILAKIICTVEQILFIENVDMCPFLSVYSQLNQISTTCRGYQSLLLVQFSKHVSSNYQPFCNRSANHQKYDLIWIK